MRRLQNWLLQIPNAAHQAAMRQATGANTGFAPSVTVGIAIFLLAGGGSGLCVRLCHNSLAMIAGVTHGVRALDAETLLSQLHKIEETFAIDEIDGKLVAPGIEGLPERTCRRLIAGVERMIEVGAPKDGI